MLLKNRELAIFSEAIAILHFPLSAAASCAKRPLPVPPPPYALQIWCRQRTHARSIPVLSSPNMCAPAATIPMPGPPPLPARCRNVLKLVLVFGAVLSQLSLLDKWGVEDDDRPPAHRALQHRHRFQRQLKKKKLLQLSLLDEWGAEDVDRAPAHRAPQRRHRFQRKLKKKLKKKRQAKRRATEEEEEAPPAIDEAAPAVLPAATAGPVAPTELGETEQAFLPVMAADQVDARLALDDAAPAAFPAPMAGPVATADQVHAALGMANERTRINQPPAIGEAAPAAFPATTAGPVATADEVHVALGMANERTLIQAAWAARVEADSRRLAP